MSEIERRKRAETELELRNLAFQLTLAEERERKRIAQGLHDEVGQLLAVARAKLGQLLETGANGDFSAQGGEICALLDRALGETRSLTFELSSPVLHEFGLTAATESLCEQLEKQSGVQFRVEGDPEPKLLDNDLCTLLYRAVRELCLNVVKHARVSHAEVGLLADADQDQDLLRIVVADDGEGFDVSDRTRAFSPIGGFGLFSIREACHHIGGTFEVESSPGKGTRVMLSVPIR